MTELLDIVGQDEALARLQRGLGGQRRPHAWLFVGPVGVGKRTTALAYARTLLCKQPVRRPNDGRIERLDRDFSLAQACGQCEDCRMAAAGSHPDLQLVYKELAQYHEDANVRNRVMQELGIDVIRSFLIAPAGRSSSRGDQKVFVVCEADLLSTAAQNSLLKTLEEPPPGTTIILLAQQVEELLPTTISRCSVVRFGPLPREFVVSRLTEQGVEPARAEFWAGLTGGSLGQALRLDQQGMYDVKCDILERVGQLTPAGDAELGEYLAKLMEKLAGDAVARAKAEAGGDLSMNLAKRQVTATLLEIIGSAFRDALCLASGAQLPVIHADQRRCVEAIARRLSPTHLADAIEQLSEYETLLWRNVNQKIVWDNVVITCASAAPLRV
ncbi:MAG: DNA polymerase III subunit tau [Planctomycetes bacterium ADurb.Bin126]|nr:MAG: DNA polymerase III subunit tau [Planctomycetes bacterium ADurb.Bin126]HOD79811.1 DNA polymerase III subunit delta' C-terminal domain-containing protein [Phycisphaerae bacterium]HQL72819.1 DNA polymerase III subunit delta' C-terminal domain-containing protein [Phycisphaerae bacterium]